MRKTFLFSVLSSLVACGAGSVQHPAITSSDPEKPDPDPAKDPVADPPKVPDGDRWTWSAGIVPAWRVDGVIGDVIALDDKLGLAIASGKLHVVALDTGAVRAQAALDGGTPTALVRAGERVLAYGNRGKLAAAWTIDPKTLAVTRLELSEPPAGASTKGRFAIAPSPDGKRVLTCSDDRWPTVRDATTFAPIATFTGADNCNNPRFVDDRRVLLDRVDSRTGGRIGEIASGKLTTVKAGTSLPLPGPGGRSATIEVRKVTISAGGREVASYTVPAFSGPLWLGDGSALVSSARGTLTVLAAASGKALRTVELPAPFRRMVAIPGTTRIMFQVGPHRLGVLDAASGKAVTAEGANLGDVAKVAVIGGAVVSGAERMRVWRDGAITATSPLAVAEAIDVDVGKPALYATLHGVFTMDLGSGAVEPIDEEASSTAADRDGDRILYDADDEVKVNVPGHADRRWFKRSDDFFITDVDAATGRIAMTDDDAFYVARPDADELFGFHSFDCQDPLYLYLERGKDRAAAYDGVTVHLYDTDKQKGLGGIELTDDNIEALAFIPGSDALVLVGESLYIWDPVKRTVIAWPLPAAHAGVGATALAVDPTGTQVAVGFADGAVLWARLDGVRAHGVPVGADIATSKPPAAVRCKGKKVATTLAEVHGLADEETDGDD